MAMCEIILALGLSFGCEAEAPIQTALPDNDPDALSFSAPPKPEPKPEPKPDPIPFPTVIVKEVVKEVEKEVLVEPEPLPEPPAPDPFELALKASLNSGANRAPSFLTDQAVLSYQQEADRLNGISVPGLDAPGSTKPQKQAEYKGEKREAGGPVDNSRIFTVDRYLIGILETGMNTQLPSEDANQVVIQVARDAFGYHGRNILIPKGSRLVCDYQSPEEQGATRFAIECNRMFTAGQRVELFQLSTSIGDQQGHNGLSGEVDTRFFEKYETALILGGISATVQGLASLAQNSAGSDSGTTASAAQEAAANLSERFGEISASSLEQTIGLQNIIRLSQGSRVMIRPRFDWYFPEPGKYPALDTAALNGLKQ